MQGQHLMKSNYIGSNQTTRKATSKFPSFMDDYHQSQINYNFPQAHD